MSSLPIAVDDETLLIESDAVYVDVRANDTLDTDATASNKVSLPWQESVGFDGKSLLYTYIYPNVGSTYYSKNITVNDSVEITNAYGAGENTYFLDISNNFIKIDFKSTLVWTSSAHNGFHLSDTSNQLADIVGVGIINNGGALQASNVTFDANNIDINWQGQSYSQAQSVVLFVAFAANGPGITIDAPSGVDLTTNDVAVVVGADNVIKVTTNTAFNALGIGESAIIHIPYRLTGDTGEKSDAVLNVTVLGENDAPTLTGAQVSLTAGVKNKPYHVSSTDLLAGFSDIDGDLLSVTHLSADHGTVTDNGDGTFTITSPLGYSGAVALSYDVSDGNGGTAAAHQNYILAETGLRLFGDNGPNILIGGAGDDILFGRLGRDTASYENASSGVTVDLSLSGKQNTVGAGWDTLNSIENLTGSAHNDVLRGHSGHNILNGGDGNDLIEDEGGNDILNGGDGDDTLSGGIGNDDLNGGAGNDTASYATAASGVKVDLNITVRQNTLGGGFDYLSGIENLIGSNHNDVLKGKIGASVLTGGAGSDQFVFLAPSKGVDQVTDFSHAQDDQLVFAGTDYGFAAGHSLVGRELVIDGFANGTGPQFLFNSANHTLYWDADGKNGAAAIKIAVLDSVNSLSADDFLFA